MKQRKQLQENLQTLPSSPNIQNVKEDTNKTGELKDKRSSSGQKKKKKLQRTKK